jgi:hypothetical protein
MPTYATWDPSNWLGDGLTLSNGNLTVANNGTSNNITARATVQITSGKWYWEVTKSASGITMCGLESIDSNALGYPQYIGGYGTTYYESSWAIRTDNGLFQIYPQNTGTFSSFGAGDVIMIAYDADTGNVWIGKNGTWFNSGDPSAGTGYVNGTYPYGAAGYPAISMWDAGVTMTANFGASAFAYSVPSGFNAGVYVSSSGTGYVAQDVGEVLLKGEPQSGFGEVSQVVGEALISSAPQGGMAFVAQDVLEVLLSSRLLFAPIYVCVDEVWRPVDISLIA